MHSEGVTLILISFLFIAFSLCAATQKTVPAPFFKGGGLPNPPQQHTPWVHDNSELSKVTEILFKQGLADPRGLEYREIEIAVGNPWSGGGYPVKTHGWIFPKEGNLSQFAVAWNGLIYPVVSVGKVADIKSDLAQMLNKTKTFSIQRTSTSEAISVNTTTLNPLKMIMLLRVGEKEAANQFYKLLKKARSGDLYFNLANDWGWFAFERAVCTHQRGDDRLALADAKMLTKIQPLIEAETKQRRVKQMTGSGKRKLPYLQYLTQLPALLTDCERRVAEQIKPPIPKDGIAKLIDDLQNVNEKQWGQPGGVPIFQAPQIQALVKRGEEVVEPLIKTMETDLRLTRSVSFGRNFFRSRHMITVPEAAHSALSYLLHVDFRSAEEFRIYWNKMGKLPLLERYYATLKDDKATPKQWLRASANIVQPVDVECHGSYTITVIRKSGQKVKFRGEKLRDSRTPSVAELMAKRSDKVAAIRTGSTDDHFNYRDACQIALYLADWDKDKAITTLKKRLSRIWNIDPKSKDILAFNGNPADNFGREIVKMTLARAKCGDQSAFDEYAVWIQKVQLEGIPFVTKELQKPLIEGYSRLSIRKAIEVLFNDPTSPWSDVFARENGSWLLEFWESPLPMTTEFRKKAFLGLADKSKGGIITFNPKKVWKSRGKGDIELKGINLGFIPTSKELKIPPPGQMHTFRVCDIFAYFYFKYHKGPELQLFWSESKRDSAVQSCKTWLSEKKIAEE